MTRAAPPLRASLAIHTSAWRKDWPLWWAEQGLFSKIFPAAFFLVYWAVLAQLGGLHADHVQVGLFAIFLAYGGRGTRSFLMFMLPLLMTVIIYDSMRYYEDYLRGPIHVSQPYNFDKRFFGISTPDGLLTPNEYWQKHTCAVLDLITGAAYLIFVAVFVLSMGYFRFFMEPVIARRSQAGMWAFFWTNMLGYSTYYWYAAAPPWYVATYGLGPARMDTPASPAGTARFDQLLGTHFFTSFYGRAADVFGAIPSLHVSYPLIAAFFAFRFKRLRVPTTLFYLLMCFSAVYLNHHYVLDILWGSSYAILICTLLDRIYLRREERLRLDPL